MNIRESEVTWHVTGDEVVILDLSGSVYLKLNGSGRVLWERLAEGADEKTLTEALVDAYDIDERLAARDAEAFVAELRRRELLEG